MKCRHCFYNEDFKKRNEIQKESFTYEELRKLFNSIKKILYLSLTGGEPFIRDDLEEVIKLFTFKNKVFRYQIPTSGYKPSLILEKTERILLNNPPIPLRIHVSLDGNNEVQKKVRGRNDSFINAVDTIKGLNKLKKKFNHFDVSVTTTICSYNSDIIDEISDIVRDIHPRGEWCINILRGEPRNPEAKNFELEAYIKAGNLINNRIRNGSYGGYSGHLTAAWLSAKNAARRKIIQKIINNNYRGGGCSAGSVSGVIYPDGSVFPCEALGRFMGNLKEYDYNLQALWNSEKADRLRNWIHETECLCTHECTLSTNFLIQPRTWLPLLSERIKYIVNK